MNKIINLFFIIIFILFFFNVYKYYSFILFLVFIFLSRSNIEEVIKHKIIGIPVLQNDTNNVIEFNDLFNKEIRDNKKRSFWDLLKSK